MARGLGSATPRSGNKDSLRLEECIDIYKFSDHPDEWVHLRLLDKDMLPVKRHWIKIISSKQKKTVSIPKFCISFDPDNESVPKEGIECPFDNISTDNSSKNADDAAMRNEFFYLFNAIIRDLQEDEPARKAKPTSEEKKTGFKDIKSKSWTPVRVVRFTNGMVARAQELGETNIVKNKKKGTKKAYQITDSKYGVDINVKYKPKAAGSEKYSIDKADDGRCAITEEEEGFLIWNLSEDLLDVCGRMTQEQADAEFKKMDILGGDNIEESSEYDDDGDGIDLDDDEDEDDDDAPQRRSKSKTDKKSKKKSKSLDDDEDEAPKKKKKKSKSLDDDEDEAPKKKKKKSSDDAPKKKKKKSSDDAPKKKKKKSVIDDDDDWDEE